LLFSSPLLAATAELLITETTELHRTAAVRKGKSTRTARMSLELKRKQPFKEEEEECKGLIFSFFEIVGRISATFVSYEFIISVSIYIPPPLKATLAVPLSSSAARKKYCKLCLQINCLVFPYFFSSPLNSQESIAPRQQQ
jgi:hypothetical protein